jgi:hypothetical protein
MALHRLNHVHVPGGSAIGLLLLLTVAVGSCLATAAGSPMACSWKSEVILDGPATAVCSVSDEILEEPLPENATAIDR